MERAPARIGGELVPEPEGLEVLRRSLVVRPGDAARETRRHLSAGVPEVDEILGGGFLRGRISEVTGPRSSGRCALLFATAAAATARGEVVAWVDPGEALDVRTAAAAGVAFPRFLWIRPPTMRDALVAADLVLGAGGFALVAVDLTQARAPLPDGACARLARGAERSGAAVVVLAESHIAGTFAAVTLDLAPMARTWRGLSPARAVLCGWAARARVARSKVGRPDREAVVRFGEAR